MDPSAVMYDIAPGKVAGQRDNGADDDLNEATMQTGQNGEQPLRNEPTELDVSYQALDSFDKYATMAHMTVHRRRQNLYALPSSNFQVLANPPFNLLDNLAAVDDAIDNFPRGEVSAADMPWNGFAKIHDHNKAQSTLRQFYRDWTAEGFAREIEPLLNMILADLEKYSPPLADKTLRTNEYSNILLPGSGLSRLLLELTLRGHNVTGNEISYHQLMGSQFILNGNASGANSWTIYPG
ncbi:uncharacterized protein AB675_6567 [Cyphellophora attinorum]|uniref:Uncharacterized protein n=1 Tax=Cyphellophora attinorum TaxID=1664694 RepID=A0A0N0NQQ7_9EURO|nr:uncharacterized protein AB675_6567 [Phialophora attinorum]KPI44188.1 hypothetical protein AB675_6567 [Phialophora attinorum]